MWSCVLLRMSESRQGLRDFFEMTRAFVQSVCCGRNAYIKASSYILSRNVAHNIFVLAWRNLLSFQHLKEPINNAPRIATFISAMAKNSRINHRQFFLSNNTCFYSRLPLICTKNGGSTDVKTIYTATNNKNVGC